MTTGNRAQPSPERLDHTIAELARRQYGVVSRAQAVRAGASNGALTRRLASGRLEPLFPGVYRVAGSAPSWRQRVLAACLALGEPAVTSHRAAARLWALPGFESETVEVSAPRTTRRVLRNVTTHHPRTLPRADRTVVDGIPVTTPTRTLIDLASFTHVERLEEVLDDALHRRLTSLPTLLDRLDALAHRGRRGIACLCELVDARASAVPESVFETRLLRLLRRAGLPEPAIQFEIWDGARFVARVDLAYPDALLAIEADGFAWHSGRARFDKDRARLNALTALGWRVVHVTWTQMTGRPEALVEQISSLLSASSARC